MSLEGWGSVGALVVAPPLRAVAAGPARALRAAKSFASTHICKPRWTGLALIGAGAPKLDAPILARASDWDDLDCKALRTKAEALVLFEPPQQRATLRALLQRAAAAKLALFVAEAGALRPLALDDLIGAAPWRVEEEKLRALLAGQRVLITGGGGSIGAALARRIAGLGAERLALLDASEANLFAIGQGLPSAHLMLADVRDGAAMQRLIARERPHLVFHAAALKQVPLVELHPAQGVLTNVVGARNVAEAARAAGADMIYVSTDKAVNPFGIMGATKRIAELYCQSADSAPRAATRVLTARLVNVLGSAGSVAPLFASQLARGGPLTVTDASMSRYFVTLAQAADFLLHCALAGLAPECPRGAVFAPAMGQPIAVLELARDLILLAGLAPDKDVKIAVVGPRPGEKLREQLIGADERRGADLAPGVMTAASPPRGLAAMNALAERLALLARAGADDVLADELLTAAAPAAEVAELAAERA
jgi:FlaA1/EpsC-like NDP-sugar epimerase